MSQAKVDRYKEEKKNRTKTIKKNKIKKAVTVVVVALGLGALIGIPLGKTIYNKQKEEAAKHATLASQEYEDWFNKKWAGEYGDLFSKTSYDDLETDASATDAIIDESSDSDASETDAE